MNIKLLFASALIFSTTATISQTIPPEFHGVWEKNRASCKQSLELNLTGDNGVVINAKALNFGTMIGCKIRKIGKLDKNGFSSEYACEADDHPKSIHKVTIKTDGINQLKLKFVNSKSNSYIKCN